MQIYIKLKPKPKNVLSSSLINKGLQCRIYKHQLFNILNNGI